MKVILIDTRHVGAALRHARRSARVHRKTPAEILHISQKELAQYESGRAVIPDDILHRIISHGIMRLNAQK